MRYANYDAANEMRKTASGYDDPTFREFVDRRWMKQVIDHHKIWAEDGLRIVLRRTTCTEFVQADLISRPQIGSRERIKQYVVDFNGSFGVSDWTYAKHPVRFLELNADMNSLEVRSPDGHGMAVEITPESVEFMALDCRLFFTVLVEQVCKDFRYVFDWWMTLDDDRQSNKLPRMSFREAMTASRKWHERIAMEAVAMYRINAMYRIHGGMSSLRKAEPVHVDGADVDLGTGETLKFEDGMYWVRLTSTDALRRETKSQGHCVGKGGYDHYATAKFPVGIWSLRKPVENGYEVYLTAEVAYVTLGDDRPFRYGEEKSVRISQCRALMNLDPLPEWRGWIEALREFARDRFKERQEKKVA